MKQLSSAVIICLLAAPAFGQAARQENQRRAAAEGAVRPQIQQLQQSIADLYLSDFRNEVELTDDQFIQLRPVIRQFIELRFQRANQRENLKQRQELLLSQPSPSDADVQQLTEERSRFESEMATLENRFIARLRSTSELSPRQALLISKFNRTFFDERLPGYIQRARAAAAAPRGQPQRPAAAARGNANRGREPARQPGNAFDNNNRNNGRQ